MPSPSGTRVLGDQCSGQSSGPAKNGRAEATRRRLAQPPRARGWCREGWGGAGRESQPDRGCVSPRGVTGPGEPPPTSVPGVDRAGASADVRAVGNRWHRIPSMVAGRAMHNLCGNVCPARTGPPEGPSSPSEDRDLPRLARLCVKIAICETQLRQLRQVSGGASDAVRARRADAVPIVGRVRAPNR